MSIVNRGWLMGVALAMLANVAVAASFPVQDGDMAVPAVSAASLAKFYPTALATSPIGVTEDKDVWLAKVQGMVSNAPAWLQQNVLASQSKSEFLANLALLEQMQKGSIEQGGAAVKSLAVGGRTKAQAVDPNNPDPLNNPPSDLVYNALEPCRIMDSRSASGGGLTNPLVGNHLYSIPGFTATNWGLYGGNAGSNCGLGNPPGGAIWAIALVVTILNPTFDAFLGMGDTNDLNTTLSNVALNYTHGQGLSTLYIVPQISQVTIFFAMPAGLSANIIFDVVGYFAPNFATALNCVDTAFGTVTLTTGAFGTAMSPACAAGYTLTGGQCSPPVYTARLAGSRESGGNSWWCDYTNQDPSAQTFSAAARCCRVPGR